METKHGSFDRDVTTAWMNGEARKMRLLNDITYTDPHGKKWDAHFGDIVDGASIPKFFWRIIGSPFVGRYRRASVVHDVYCKSKSEPSKDVHKMFHNAMLCDGVSKTKARLMYWAVKFGGPRW